MADSHRIYRAVDLFSGVGGMSLGFEQAGVNVIAGVDANPLNTASYARNFPYSKAIQADLSRIDGHDLRKRVGLRKKDRLDILFGGPPCQGFSIIGRRRFDDHRNELLLHFARLVRQLQPRYFVVENVAGLVVGDTRLLLESFLRRAKRAGYHVREVQVLCATDFGVPQRRERVFILGCLKKLDLPNYPSPRTPFSNAWGKRKPNVWSAIGDLPNVDHFDYLFEQDELLHPLKRPSSYAAVLRGENTDPSNHAVKRTFLTRGLGGCLRTLHSKKTVRRFAETEPGTSEPTSRYFRLDKSSNANTLRAGTGPDYGSYTAARPIHPIHPRCITVREAARLHSFPDWFSFHPTKWHGFQQVGNSVPPLFARAIAASILDAIWCCKD